VPARPPAKANLEVTAMTAATAKGPASGLKRSSVFPRSEVALVAGWPSVSMSARRLYLPNRDIQSQLYIALGSPILRRVGAPYRDELESLRRENERLRAALWKRGSTYPKLALILVALDVVLAVVLRPWLNGANDSRFWTAVSALAGLGLTAAALAIGRRSLH
jgi:hypothetical protein